MAQIVRKEVRVRQRKLITLAIAAALIGGTLLLIGNAVHAAFVIGAGCVGLAAGLLTLAIVLPLLVKLP